eukprot:TRINITY_DN2386_c0_g1_i1.p2 TRINITY_DN2386_c0_g1~~TRINITY_DN2386_c0_g1_i1.p2  ORF type:complete len:109 (-),score=19.53 TRINITY_DN2386_c0_g1_i1:32-358(-)
MRKNNKGAHKKRYLKLVEEEKKRNEKSKAKREKVIERRETQMEEAAEPEQTVAVDETMDSERGRTVGKKGKRSRSLSVSTRKEHGKKKFTKEEKEEMQVEAKPAKTKK